MYEKPINEGTGGEQGLTPINGYNALKEGQCSVRLVAVLINTVTAWGGSIVPSFPADAACTFYLVAMLADVFLDGVCVCVQ